MSRPVWMTGLIKKTFPNRFLVARLTRWPVVGKLLDRMLFEGDDLVYLPQERVLSLHVPVEQPEGMVLPAQVVNYFIEKANVHWIMNSCICREAEQCQDYPPDLGCLFLGQAALGINPKLGRRVTKAEALAHARRSREAGLVHLIGRNKLDTVWLGVGPGEKLLTICNCCPCCCLWRVLPHVDPAIAGKVSRLPGVRVTVSDACVGCGTCTRGICFVEAIHLVNGRAVIHDACRGCGRCVSVCPEGAITLTVDDQAELARQLIERIAKLVDVE